MESRRHVTRWSAGSALRSHLCCLSPAAETEPGRAANKHRGKDKAADPLFFSWEETLPQTEAKQTFTQITTNRILTFPLPAGKCSF